MPTKINIMFSSLFIISLTVGLSFSDITISNPLVTNWGIWGKWERCPSDTYAVAFQVKTEAAVGYDDDTALNGIRLYCDTPGNNSLTTSISSSVGGWGVWGQIFYCEGLLTGFQLRSEESLNTKNINTVICKDGIQYSEDDTAANNFKGFCASSNVHNAVIEADGLVYGKWTRAQHCLKRQAICGIRTQVETYQGDGDDTSLNNVDLQCCDIPDPGATCLPTDDWDLIIECDNSEGLVPLKCSFVKKNGVSVSQSDSDSGSSESSTLLTVGFTLDYVGRALSSNFKTNLEHSTITKHYWSSESSQTWNEEMKHAAEFTVEPGMISSLYQVVGRCKYFNVFTTKFKKRDVVKGHGLGSNNEVNESEYYWP